MKLAVFADRERQGFIEPLLQGCFTEASDYELYESYDNFIQGLSKNSFDAVIVAHKGALGMQSVRAAKILHSRVPIVWLSDDDGFVEESYRVGCAYFSTEAITEKLLSDALYRCRQAACIKSN